MASRETGRMDCHVEVRKVVLPAVSRAVALTCCVVAMHTQRLSSGLLADSHCLGESLP